MHPASAGMTTCRQLRSILRLPGGLEQARFQRLAGTLARPKHKLKRLVMAFAGIERDAEQGLALRVRCRDAAGEDEGVTKHDDAVIDPDIEMSDPELFIDERRELDHFRAPAVRHLELERAGKMQRLDVGHPGE